MHDLDWLGALWAFFGPVADWQGRLGEFGIVKVLYGHCQFERYFCGGLRYGRAGHALSPVRVPMGL